MARELISYQIVVDERPAQQALSRVEASQQRVESGAQKMGREVDAALTKAREHAAKVTEAYNRGEASTKEWAAAQRELTKAQADVAAATEKTAEAVKKTDAATKDATQSAGVMSNALQGLGRTIVAAFAVERIVSFGQEAIRTGSQIKDLSDRTGISVRAIQELGYAAERSGTRIETVADAIDTMSRNLVTGNKGAVGALDSMGLSLRRVLDMQPDQAFLEIAEAIGQIQNPMERATAAQQVFGQRGKELLPGMAEGWRSLAEEAGKVGAVIDDKNIAALARFEQAWTRMERVAKTAIGNILGSLFRLHDGIQSAVPPWLQQGIQRTMLSTPVGLAAAVTEDPLGLRDRLWNRAFLGGDEFGPSVPEAPPSGANWVAGLRGGTWAPASVDDLLKVQVPAPVIQSHKDMAKAAKESAESVEQYIRAQVAVIGVNRQLRLAPSHPFARTGIAGAITSAGDSPFLPSTNPLSMTTLAPGNIRSGFSGSQPTPFWDSARGRALGAGIGIAGGAAIGAMAGGDSYASMVGGAASAVSAAALSGTMSAAALGAATMGIGAAAVGVYMLAKHFTTVSKEVKQARVDIAEFQQELWKTATATQMNEAAGRDWAATVIVVRDAYSRMGKSAAEAEADVLALWDDSNPERAREAMQKIAGVMDDFRAILAKANTEMATLLQQASQLATRLPQGLLDQLQALVDRGDLTGANADLVRQLSGASAIDYDRMKARADALGLDPDALGQGFVQHQTTKTAQQYIDDIQLFRDAGITDGTILAGMADELSGLVQESLKFKTEVPSNLQPFIQNLMDTGRLLDENGDKITDISEIKWGEPLKTSTERLIDSIQDLIDTLNGPLQRAFDNIPDEVRTRHIIEREELPAPPPRERPEGYQHGGVVYAAQGYVARGTDTVPAMLTPGEGVLSRRGMAMLGALNSGLPGVGGGGVDYGKLAEALVTALRKQPPVVSMSGRVVSQQLVPHLGPALREAGAWR